MSELKELSLPFLAKDTKEYLSGPATLLGIVEFPGKSMAPLYLEKAFVDFTGIKRSENAPNSDRQYMLTDEKGLMQSQRNIPELARLHISFTDLMVKLTFDGSNTVFPPKKTPETAVQVHKAGGIAAVDQGDGVAEWLTGKLNKKVRLVRQVDTKPRERHDAIAQMKGLNTILRLQDSSPITALGMTTLDLLNQSLAQHQWYMEALSFRMNLLFGGNFNEHLAVGKFIKIGTDPDAVYLYCWRPKERCPMPANDPIQGGYRSDEGKPQEKMSYVFQQELKKPAMQDALGIPAEWRTTPAKGNKDDIVKASLGIDMFPINRGTIRVGDPIEIVDEVPAHIMAQAQLPN